MISESKFKSRVRAQEYRCVFQLACSMVRFAREDHWGWGEGSGIMYSSETLEIFCSLSLTMDSCMESLPQISAKSKERLSYYSY